MRIARRTSTMPRHGANAGAALLQGGEGADIFAGSRLWSALQHAAVRMAERELVRTAAMDAGFADTAHLSRVFSSMFGLSPSVAIAGLDERKRV
jgi:hypothetical protein